MSEPDNQRHHLAYYAERHCSSQWRLFIEMVFDELLGSAGEEGAAGFLSHIGTRMAADMPIGECETLEDLEHCLNGALGQLDWGWVNVSADNQKIRLCHSAIPVPMTSSKRSDASLLAMSFLLEGLFKAWLRQQGGDAEVPIACLSRQSSPCECVFVYGH